MLALVALQLVNQWQNIIVPLTSFVLFLEQITFGTNLSTAAEEFSQKSKLLNTIILELKKTRYKKSCLTENAFGVISEERAACSHL